MKELPTPLCDPKLVDFNKIALLATHIRASSISLSHKGKTPHLGSALSCADIVSVCYGGSLLINPANVTDALRDRFILSKGHAATALYSCLALQGFFPSDALDTYAQPGSMFAEQPIPNSLPGIEAATGSLGHGLPIGVGIALSAKIMNQSYRVVTLLSDGECNEGTVWEAALFAAAQHLSNVTVIIDFNKWQATGRSEEIMSLAPLVDKWRAFGWNATEVDGHNIQELRTAIAESDPKHKTIQKPCAIIAHTIKGKGISFMEDDNNWHYRIPNETEVAAAYKELGVQ